MDSTGQLKEAGYTKTDVFHAQQKVKKKCDVTDNHKEQITRKNVIEKLVNVISVESVGQFTAFLQTKQLELCGVELSVRRSPAEVDIITANYRKFVSVHPEFFVNKSLKDYYHFVSMFIAEFFVPYDVAILYFDSIQF